MEQQGYLRTFRERWIAIVVGLLLGVWVAAAVGSAIPPTYTATSTLFLSVQSDVGTLSERSQFALARISSYPELAYSSDVLGKTITSLGLNESVAQLSKSISATNPSTTVLLQIQAEAKSPKLAADIANSVATNLSSDVSTLENSSTDDRYTVSLELRNRAQPPVAPSAPQLNIIVGLGAVVGLALGLIAALVWAILDTGIRSVDEVRRVSGLPVIGELPRSGGRARDGSRAAIRWLSALRETQLTIRQANASVLPDFLVLVPSSRSAGQADIRIGLARSLASTGRSVCLLESDFDAPLGALAPAAGAKGLAEVLGSDVSADDVAVQPDGEQFMLISAGDRANLPKEYDAELRISEVVSQLTDSYDVTLTQATSITQPATVELVAPYADGVVVLVRFARTKRADLAHVLSRLRVMGIRPLGVVLTGVPALRRTDLAAGWLPGDFNEVKREPIARAEVPANTVSKTVRAAPRPRV